MQNLPRPSRPTAGQLSKVGVELRDVHNVTLGCLYCGKGWQPMIQRGGKMPRGYWRCPNGCNSDENLANE